MRGRKRLLRVGLRRLDDLDLGGQLLGAVEHRGPFVGGRGPHLLADRLLFGTQGVGGRNRRAPCGVGVEQRIDEPWVLAASVL